MTISYIGLGSNLDSPIGTPLQIIGSAIDALKAMSSVQVIKESSLYKSKPVGPQDQADYVNAVAEIECHLEADTLLDKLQQIEDEHQRVREVRWGARTLDLDILLFGDKIINTERLTVPHVEMTKRNFVLRPLVEINPGCIIPGVGNASDFLEQLDQDGLEKLR